MIVGAGRGAGAGRRERHRQVPRSHGRDEPRQRRAGTIRKLFALNDRREFGARLGRAGERREGDQVLLLRHRDRRLRLRGPAAMPALSFGGDTMPYVNVRISADGNTAGAKAAGDRADHPGAGRRTGQGPRQHLRRHRRSVHRQLGPSRDVGDQAARREGCWASRRPPRCKARSKRGAAERPDARDSRPPRRRPHAPSRKRR